MLAGDFFYITSLEQESGKINAVLEINDTHSIFEGHFPGQPVVPGVCMMQMVKEILESALTIKTKLVSAGQMKFLTIIDPTENNSIHATIKYTVEEDGKIKLGASLVDDTVVYFKMDGVLAPLPR
ncbi:MAG: 3-hydroxyacyl-ACP dehydratase [Ferruginibacter sp.]|nr:3-hydroxyacyl-ACP dehydratase [Ferruginibacter sp.]